MNVSRYQLRPARPTDLIAVVALEQATQYAPHWSPAVYAAILAGQDEQDDRRTETSQRRLIVAEQAEGDRVSLKGFAVGQIYPAPGQPSAAMASQSTEHLAEIESVVVAANFRRAGIGRALCREVIEWCRTRGATAVVLEVRASSVGAIALYAKLGFVATGRRPHYYRDPKDDALNMRLAL